MNWSTLKFVLLAIGAIFVASSDAKIVWAQDEDRVARRLNQMQMPVDNLPSQVGSQQHAPIDHPAAKEIAAAAQEIGLDGRWIVLNVDKDGELTKAQIGQQPNDVISIVPGEDSRGPLAFG